MTAIDKYNNAFIESFELSVDELSGLNYQGTELWDSVAYDPYFGIGGYI